MENYLNFIFSVIIFALYAIKVYKDTSKQSAKSDLERTIETIIKEDDRETLLNYINAQDGWIVFTYRLDSLEVKHYKGEEIWVGGSIWALSYNGKDPKKKDIERLNKSLQSSSYTTYKIYKLIKPLRSEKENCN